MTHIISDSRFKLNWGTVNVPTILALAGVCVTLIGTYFKLDNRVSNIETSHLQRSAEINKVIDVLTQRTLTLDNIQYRVALVEQGVADVNRRADRINEGVSARLDKMQDFLSQINTKVEVLVSQQSMTETPAELRKR